MRNILLLCLLASACSDEILIPEKKCDVPCAVRLGEILFNKEALAVTCRPAVSVCDSDGVPSCPNYEPPAAQEMCGFHEDDDCDPSTTEADIRIPPGDSRNTCRYTEKGICKYADTVCINGELVCDPNFARQEICDPFFQDEDCDGLVNGLDPSMVLLGPLFAYDGDLSTVNVGICRAGVARCVNGAEVYDGMVLPREEECGNGLDDDCDGLVDEPSDDSEPRSFLLVIDYSGSMGPYINSVETALCNWSLSRPQDIFGVAAFGVAGNAEEYVAVSPFSSASDACADMLGFRYYPGGWEYGANAIHRFLENEEWTTDDRSVIIFTDEEYQSYTHNDASRLIEDCEENSYTVGVYALQHFQRSFTTIAAGCNGWMDDLSIYPDQMINSLTSRFAGTCE
jgi:hypothetical protein